MTAEEIKNKYSVYELYYKVELLETLINSMTSCMESVARFVDGPEKTYLLATIKNTKETMEKVK